MKQKRANTRYRSEKVTFRELGMAPHSGSGSGVLKEDASDEYRVGQAKSTAGKSITVDFLDLHQVRSHAGIARKPIFVLEFETPSVGQMELPAERWVCIPIEDYKKLWEGYGLRTNQDDCDMGKLT